MVASVIMARSFVKLKILNTLELHLAKLRKLEKKGENNAKGKRLR